MDNFTLLLSLAAVLTAIYYYVFKNLSYFKRNKILHKPPVPFFGNMVPFLLRRKTMVDTLQEIYDLNGDAKYVGFYEFTTPIILLRDADLIKSITIKNFTSFTNHQAIVEKDLEPVLGNMLFTLPGEKWKDMRVQLTPTFTSSKIKMMFMLMSHVAVNFSHYLANLPEKERELELKEVLTKYTSDVIASCVFGINVDTIKDPKNPIYVKGKKATDFNGFETSMKFMLQKNLPWIAKLFSITVLDHGIQGYFTDTIRNTVKQRLEQGIHRPDMLQNMIDMSKNNKSEKPLTMEDIVCNAFSFFFGGYNSVASQACSIIHDLVEHPDIQKRLQEEIDEVLENTQGKVTYDAIINMEYMDAVMNESMRVHPSPIFIDRKCSKDFELPPALPGGEPVTVKAGTIFWVAVHSIHHDPRYFENPHHFDPERFLQDGKRIMNSGAFVPFGLGPRMCIGTRFALTEIKVLLFYIFARSNAKACSKTTIPLELSKVTTFINTASKGFWVKMEPRKNCSQFVDCLASNGIHQE
nr:cytochrome P450 9e2-like [Nomia melanderi]